MKKSYETAISLSPNEDSYYLNKGRALKNLGKADEAIEWFV